MHVLFVCLGNICRSPTAEGVLRHKLAEQGLCDQVQVDSAGTGDWHIGHRVEDAFVSGLELGLRLCGK